MVVIAVLFDSGHHSVGYFTAMAMMERIRLRIAIAVVIHSRISLIRRRLASCSCFKIAISMLGGITLPVAMRGSFI